MTNENAIRAAAIALLIGVVIVSYMQWGKGIDEIEPPTKQEFQTPEQITAASAASKKKKAQKNANLPSGGGWAEGEEGPDGDESARPGSTMNTTPSGGGWTEGEEGEEGKEGSAPGGSGTPAGAGWEEGQQGPEGTEGIMPDGEPANGAAIGLCWKKPKASKKYGYQFSGSVATEGFPGDKGPLKEWAVVAVDKPVSDWDAGSIVEVHGLTTGLDAEFSLEITSSEKKLHLCAVWPASLGQFQGIRLAACLPKALLGDDDAPAKHGDLSITPKALNTQLLVISGSEFGDGIPRQGGVKREISGSVEALGVQAGSFMVTAAASAILDEQESQDSPRAMQMTNESGRFTLSYITAKDEPLYLCAMAFAKGKKLSKVKGIEGQGCTEVAVPAAGPGGLVKIVGAQVTVNAEKMPLAPHELDHLSLVGRCSTRR